ncbi:MAG: hypothetical protein AAFV80_09515, partial [Bacteroidota bacterium]
MKNDALFLLVHSMTSAERRHFKLFVERTGKKANNYVRLFDAIFKQQEYDEVKLKAKFKQETFIRQLHVTKNQLHQLLLRSLRNKASRETVQQKLLNYLADMENLYQRELFDQCYEIGRKAEKLALRHEKFSLYLEVLFWMRRLALNHSNGLFQD